eukprot:TRINITY_DN5805_c0_g1_i1.p1 TRINITY_DN5805_c0_g1~~TRINITY_DN5805_c0_g1_i1.p1  ORF type:complete len:602 (+),score=69.22 TRINITY_DN5805_c0_g1_i1:2307-4112(+)
MNALQGNVYQKKNVEKFRVSCQLSSNNLVSIFRKTQQIQQLKLGKEGYIVKPSLRWKSQIQENELHLQHRPFSFPPEDFHKKLVTAFIQTCDNITAVSVILQLQKSELSPTNVSAAICRIGHLYANMNVQELSPQQKDSLQIAQELAADLFIKNVTEYSDRQMVTVLWGMVTSQYENDQFYKFWLKEATARISSFSARQSGLALWCLSFRGWSQDQEEHLFTDATIRKAQMNIQEFKSLDLTQSLIALARNEAQVGDPLVLRLFNKASRRQIELLPMQNSQGIVNTLWAYARLRIPAPLMVQKINQHIAHHPEKLTPQHISVILWSYSRIQFFDRQTFQILARRINASMHTFTAQGISAVMYAFCWYLEYFTVDHEDMYRQGKDLFIQRMDEFEPLHISNMLYAYSAISTVRGEELFDIAVELMEAAVDRVIQDFRTFDLYCVSIVALAYGRMGLADDQLFELINKRVRVSIADFKITNLVSLLYGLVTSGRPDREILKLVLKQILFIGQSLLPQMYVGLLQKSLNNIRIPDPELDKLVLACQTQLGMYRKARKIMPKSPYQDWLQRSTSLSFYESLSGMRYDGSIDMNSYEEIYSDGTDY